MVYSITFLRAKYVLLRQKMGNIDQVLFFLVFIIIAFSYNVSDRFYNGSSPRVIKWMAYINYMVEIDVDSIYASI